MGCVTCWKNIFGDFFDGSRISNRRRVNTTEMRCHLQISSYRIDLMSVNGPISPKQCYYEIDYSFYSFYCLDSLKIRLDHNSTYYRSLSKNSDVKHRISLCDSQNLQYKTHPEFWPSHRRIFKTSLYYKTRLILETRRYITWVKILHGIEYQRPTSLNMRILADHVTYSFLAFPKSIF